MHPDIQAGLNRELFYATIRGTLREVNRLIQKGAEVSATNAIGYLCNVVIFKRPVGMINALVKAGAEINAAYETGKTTLHAAVRFGRISVAKKLIAQGADVDAFDMVEGTPLRVAVDIGNVAMVWLLLEAGANVDGTVGILRDPLKRDQTTLHVAVHRRNNNPGIVEMLVGAGANVDAMDGGPLRAAVDQGNVGVVRLLLSAGASVDNTLILVIAALEGNVGVMKQLIAAGAPVRPPNGGGEKYSTPLHIAADNTQPRRRDPEIVEVLIHAGAPLDALDADGFTPLMCSVWSGFVRASLSLIQAGALGGEVNKEDLGAFTDEALEQEEQELLLGVLLIQASACRGGARDHTACSDDLDEVGKVGVEYGVWSEAMQQRAGSSTRALAAGSRKEIMSGDRALKKEC